MAAKVPRLNLVTTENERTVPDTNRLSLGKCANRTRVNGGVCSRSPASRGSYIAVASHLCKTVKE
jgi:hypothetical protein